MRASPITIPSAIGIAPPERPVPAPRATNGTPWSDAIATAAATSAVVRGSTTACGIARQPVRPSHSYVRSSAGSVSTASRGSAARSSATSVMPSS